MNFWHREGEKSMDETIIKHLESGEDTEEVNECEDTECESADKNTEEANFNALSCFGWNENKTDKWLIKCAHIWFGLMSFVWFLFGALTFAPIIFISNKVNVIFKNKTKSMICAIIIYAVVIGLIALLISMRSASKVS